MERLLITILIAEICLIAGFSLVSLPLLIGFVAFTGFIFIGDLATVEYRTSRAAPGSTQAVRFDWAFLVAEGVVFTALLLMLITRYQ